MYGDRHNMQTVRSKPQTAPKQESGITANDALLVGLVVLTILIILLGVGKYFV